MEGDALPPAGSFGSAASHTAAPFRLPAGESAGALPRITLPTGGGAIRGIEEQFQANPATGTATLALPLPVGPARQGFAPTLALAYDSGTGNSPFGLGWQVAVPSVARKTERGLPRYRDNEDSDVFLLTGAEDLTPMLEEAGGTWVPVEELRTEAGTHYKVRRYRPRAEGAFARIERWQRLADSDIHWRVTTPDNIHTVYGQRPEARIADPDDPGRVFQWLVQHAFDDRGNCIRYAYKAEDLNGLDGSRLHEKNRHAGVASVTNRYLKAVRYGNAAPYRPGEPLPDDFLFEAVFDYGEHDQENPQPDDDGAWSLRHDPFSTCRPGFEVRTYRSCQRVLLFHRFETLGAEPCLVRALTLRYDDQPGFKFLTEVVQTGYLRHADGTYTEKSLPPLTFAYQPLAWNTKIQTVAPEDGRRTPAGLDGRVHQWVDLWGEGITGVLSEYEPGWFYARNRGDGHFAPAELVASKPSFSGIAAGRLTITDLDGDGRQAAVQFDGIPKGFFRVLADEDWDAFRVFRRAPTRATQSPQARWIDLNGDGRPDLMVDEDEVFVWYPFEGEAGFAEGQVVRKVIDDEQGPAVVFADTEQVIFLADLNGDGLTDIVRLRNGEVVYWPNEGHGRFGARVTMTGAPHFDHPERFDPRLLRLADIDGSGTADLIYLGLEHARLWRNLSGNAWSEAPITITGFPPTDPATDVQVLDFRGDGTACIVWSSPLPGEASAPTRYVDLLGGLKPHVLVGYTNNAGSEVALHYRSSTRFYLDDEATGTPWVTKLPFPVHCLHRVETRNRVRGSYFASEYTYHHGYFDHAEREFRGFGRVDQRDTEIFEHFALSDATNVVAEPLHQPPVLTKTWFHTGAFLDRERLLAHFQHEYYANAALIEHVPPDPSLPAGLSAEETREAFRACKGMLLRQEIYALDDTSGEPHPHAVSGGTCQVRLLQPRRNDQRAAFLVIPRESMAYDYERNPADPRIAHSLVLETDELGNALRSSSVVYPRQAPDPGLPTEVQAEQARRVVTYTETDYTNDVVSEAAYRLRVPFEGRSYELTGAAPTSGTFFTAEDLDGQTTAATAISYETVPSSGLEKRLLGHNRLYFLADDLGGPLPLGTQEPLGLGHRVERLAFTPDLVTRLYGTRVTDALLAEAGYVHSEGDANWWASSGTAVYRVDAAEHFLLPTGSRDPFGTVLATATYDAFDLLATSTQDALGNRVEVVNDYRLLGPVQTTDPNGSRTAVEVDELGLVVASAVMGRDGENEGDTLADPTVRLEYDLDNWRLNGEPNYVHTFAREQHGASNPRWQEAYVYSDGHGVVVMTKTQAEPGIARRFDPATGTVVEEDTTPAVRWVGSGRTILNNKGNAVKQYEPYFSTTPAFEDEAALVETGVTPLLYYDPLGRLVRSELPDGTLSTVAFDAWMQTSADANDTALESDWYTERSQPDPAGPEPTDPDERAAWLAAQHAHTPVVTHADALGRTVYAVADNGPRGLRAFRTETDLTGHVARVFDPHDREVALGMTNMLGATCYGHSAEKGDRWTLANVVGNTVRLWDGADRTFRPTFDVLHRPLATHFQPTHGAEAVVSLNVYGEGHPSADALRLRGRLYRTYDQAGAVSLEGFDFKGNPLRIERQLARDYKNTVDWSALTDQPTTTLDALAAPLLETEVFFGTTIVDALDRLVEARFPEGTLVRSTYNEANIPETLSLQLRGTGPWTTFLENQHYNAKGQRLLAEYGNNTRTRYAYDPLTDRLTQLQTHRTTDDALLQDLRYTHDAAGNITQHSDEAQQTLFFNNAVVRPESLYEYDALYQLVTATGREHASGGPQPDHAEITRHPLPHPNDTAAVRTYTEHYDYDSLGNILQMRHVATAGSWTRHYRYAYHDDPADRTNRLVATSRPGDHPTGPFTATYSYDANGNMNAMPHLGSLEWGFLDQLREVDLRGGGTAYYVYNGASQRVRKVIHRPGGQILERIYVGGVEFYREHRGGDLELERQTVHVADNGGRVAQVDTKTVDTADPTDLDIPVIRYIYGNHLGSATLETDETGALVSYEEYQPFGTTAYRSGRSAAEVSLKRYRYIGKERDDETSFYACGLRYYAPWLGRWTSPDPAGFVDGLNLYSYSRNNPIRLSDPGGMQATEYNTVFSTRQTATAEERAVLSNPESDPAAVLGIYQKYGYSGGGPLEWSPHYRGGGWVEAEPAGSPASTNDGGQQAEDNGGENEAPAEGAPQHSSAGAPAIPLRPALGPASPSPLTPLDPVPQLDITPAPSGATFADFQRAERAARAAYREAHQMSGRQSAVQHPLKWREGARTRIHPRIPNHPKFLHPISNVRGTGGIGDNGRPYATQHTLADRGRYPSEAAATQRRYGPIATERVTSLWAGQRVRQRTIGSRGPLFLREYIVAPMLRGAGGHFALASTRTFVPLVVEAELGMMGAGMALHSAGYQAAGVAVFGYASYVPVVGGGLVGGAIAGNAAESVAAELGASSEVATGVGAGGAILGGAAVGALIGSIIPVVGTGAGAAIGAGAGLIGYGLSKLF